jgi:enterobactin synthetase component D
MTDALRSRDLSITNNESALWIDAPHRLPRDAAVPKMCAAALSLEQLSTMLNGQALEDLIPPTLHGAVRKRQVEFIGGRLCAERALEQFTVKMHSVPRGEEGEPIWPQGIHGSIAHTSWSAYSVIVDSDSNLGIGIDSESIVNEDTRNVIAEYCCTQTERSRWFHEQHELCATLIFSAKEAFYKAVYPTVRRFIDFDEVEVVAWDDQAGELILMPVREGRLAKIVQESRITYRIDNGVHPVLHTTALAA